MGLDMYLSAELCISTTELADTKDANGRPISYTNPTAQAIATLAGYPGEMDDFNFLRVHVPIGYWRKANQIHAWFVKDQPEDDCKPFNVDLERLAELDKLCQQVLKDPTKAEELLPTQSGFFFGATALSDPDKLKWYLEDLKHTRKVIKRCRALVSHRDLVAPGSYAPDFTYCASW